MEDQNSTERYRLCHVIRTKGNFYLKLKDRSEVIFGQHHTLEQRYEYWDESDNEWCDGDDVEVLDEFYLTRNDKGYKYTVEVLNEIYEIEDLDFEWNGISSDWSGIKEDDSVEEAKSKWYYYKAGFPSVKSKDQFKDEH